MNPELIILGFFWISLFFALYMLIREFFGEYRG